MILNIICTLIINILERRKNAKTLTEKDSLHYCRCKNSTYVRHKNVYGGMPVSSYLCVYLKKRHM